MPYRKCSINLNVRVKTIKLLERKQSCKSAWLWVRQWFLKTSKTLLAKEKANGLHFIKIKNFCASKHTNKKMKTKAAIWKAIISKSCM